MQKANKFTYSLTALFAVLVFIFSSLWGGGAAVVHAATSTYSNVLDDLKKDSNFAVSYYPEKADDYSLQVIQLAESSENELFIYVYQPSGQTKNLSACSINISTTVNDDISFYNYKLKQCNSSGVFYKYVVQDFTVSTAPTRYYAISSIYRPFDETIDKGAEHGKPLRK